MITMRDTTIAVVSILLTCFILSLTHADNAVIGASVYNWNDMDVRKTDVGEYRQVMRGPTATLDELELHVTTLMPGKDSHPPHRHPNEELVILREGTVESLSNGKWEKLGPGSVIFNATNSLHALRNIGNIPAVYHVINWKTPATPVASPTQ